MPRPLLTIGPFVFEDLEIPESISINKKQRTTIYRTGDGTSLIDVLGEDYQEISFSGIFSGRRAAARLRQLDLLRAQGIALQLTWETETVVATIHALKVIYKSSMWISYSIKCYTMTPKFLNETGNSESIFGSVSEQVSEIGEGLSYLKMPLSPDQVRSISVLSGMNYDIADQKHIDILKTLYRTLEIQNARERHSETSIKLGSLGSSSLSGGEFLSITSSLGSEVQKINVRNKIQYIVVQSLSASR